MNSVTFGKSAHELIIRDSGTSYIDCGVDGFSDNPFYSDIFYDGKTHYVSSKNDKNSFMTALEAQHKASNLVDKVIETFNIPISYKK